MTRERLTDALEKGPIICAEGYVFELERRGYLQAGPFVPTVVLDDPDAVKTLHRDFARAGSDVIEALTYYAHREKLRVVGYQDRIEELNKQALQIAREVADEFDCYVAGNISNTNIYDPSNPVETEKEIRKMFEEQVQWAVDAGVDYIIGETFDYASEALIALDVIKQTGLPSVITATFGRKDQSWEGWSAAEVAKRLEQAGADVIGINCCRGPETMLPLLKEMRAATTCQMAALPVPYRTTQAQPNFEALQDPGCSCSRAKEQAFPDALDGFTCTRYEIAEFGKTALDLGINYLGVCCGAGPQHIRSLAEAVGKETIASKYSPDMSKHFYFGEYEDQAATNKKAGGASGKL